MSTTYHAPGCYRCVRGVRVLLEKDGGLAICDYPLRAVHLLAHCSEQRTDTELAQHTPAVKARRGAVRSTWS